MLLFQSAKHELKAGQDRLRALAANTSAVVWHTAADGAVAQRNPSWEAFTGQSAQESMGWGWTDAVHPDDRELLMEEWRTAVEGSHGFETMYRLRRHDGEHRYMLAQGTPVTQDGKVREWVGVCVDVTESRKAELALRESEERFRFLDRLGQATRAQTDATDVMATSARLLGEYLGATRCAYADVEADSNRFTIRNDWTAEGVASSAGAYSLDLFGPQATSNLRQGRHLVVRDVDRELGDEGGGRMFNAIGIKAVICAGLVKGDRLVAMMAVHQATPRDWTQQEISLITEVVERCWAHIERVRDNAILREQDRRKDEFLATLAHELRNPLAPIKYALAMMRRARDASQVEKAQDVIDRQVSQMARLIDDLLDLSRINRGLVELKRERVGVLQLVQSALEVARPGIEAAGHALQVELPAEDLFVDADPTRIVQVISNLLGNAAKYTPDGGNIRLSAAQRDGHVVIEVRDNGIGIPPEQQGQLFQMFTQLQHSTARAKGGLGIGLSLVKTLVQMHGGNVSSSSAGLDAGSTFTVELPLAATAGATAPADMRPPEPRATGGMRILVVEDNEDGRQMLVALLQILGYEVDSAPDGAHALEVAGRFQPRIVLLDLGLPVMDGYEVCRRLREMPEMRGAAIVALTGWGAEKDRARTAQAGFDAHLTKPVEPQTLQQTLDGYA
ncbi:hybrid sensor histidine kinase/response regulator [Ramlibacter pallidus]|uniref:histidine kinase n=1 Tax=Ramlibacter pallidus TaxID=2780087 RepID=A0ABR9S5C0_9BURK|nr:ATP-binding protein [Ramlibacter pallidus]MBE7368706.1 response regulator [Ramlibacter pallidus]